MSYASGLRDDEAQQEMDASQQVTRAANQADPRWMPVCLWCRVAGVSAWAIARPTQPSPPLSPPPHPHPHALVGYQEADLGGGGGARVGHRPLCRGTQVPGGPSICPLARVHMTTVSTCFSDHTFRDSTSTLPTLTFLTENQLVEFLLLIGVHNCWVLVRSN